MRKNERNGLVNMKKNGFCVSVNLHPTGMIVNQKQALIELQSKAYKYVIKNKERNYLLQVALRDTNLSYNSCKNDYNTLTPYIMNNLSDEVIRIIKSVVHNSKKMSVKRIKKNLSRIRREVKGVYRTLILNNDADKFQFYNALDAFYMAVRDSFVISRKSLSKEAYNAIPNDLTENCVSSGLQYIIRDVFVLNNDTGKYIFKSQISDNINLTDADLRQINRTIAPYVFFAIHQI